MRNRVYGIYFCGIALLSVVLCNGGNEVAKIATAVDIL
jgi:hypothetical protein